MIGIDAMTRECGNLAKMRECIAYPMNFAAAGSSDGNHSHKHFHGPGRFQRITYIEKKSCLPYNLNL